jgi:LmbE family N-acetylglucosaminyl deacetylase
MKVLAFGAHPDDLEIGMGGTVARYTARGHEVLMVVATVPNRKEYRVQEAEEAAGILGADLVVMDVVPDELVFSRQLVRRFDQVFNGFVPDVVYTHSNNDSHQDHAAVTNAVIATTRKNDCSVYMYEQTIPGGIAPNPFHGSTTSMSRTASRRSSTRSWRTARSSIPTARGGSRGSKGAPCTTVSRST